MIIICVIISDFLPRPRAGEAEMAAFPLVSVMSSSQYDIFNKKTGKNQTVDTVPQPMRYTTYPKRDGAVSSAVWPLDSEDHHTLVVQVFEGETDRGE